jgi:hypothetical protein
MERHDARKEKQTIVRHSFNKSIVTLTNSAEKRVRISFHERGVWKRGSLSNWEPWIGSGKHVISLFTQREHKQKVEINKNQSGTQQRGDSLQ